MLPLCTELHCTAAVLHCICTSQQLYVPSDCITAARLAGSVWLCVLAVSRNTDGLVMGGSNLSVGAPVNHEDA